MDKSSVRKLFPYLQEGIIYFNHASTGPLSTFVTEKLTDLLNEKSRHKIDDYDSFLTVVGETKELLSKLINAKSDRLAFVDNTSNGINIIAQSFDWKKGDRILLNDIEFPANVYPFLNLQRLGVAIDFVKSENGIVTAESIINSVKPETRMISVSFVQFLSGYRIDLEKIGSYCRANNIIFCVDGIQGVGAVNIDVQKDKIDFLACGTQKWLMGLQGLGFIYIHEDLQSEIHPANLGWLSVNNAWDLLDYKLDLKSTANVFQGGTLNSFGIFALNSSLKLFNEFGFNKIEENVLENSIYLLKSLMNLGYNPVLENCDKKNIAGIVTYKPDNPKLIFENFSKKKIVCSLREAQIRFSSHFYNTKEEIDIVVDELRKI